MVGMCFFCNKESGTMFLLGHLPGDAEAPRKAVANMEPCEECKRLMGLGVILISVREPKTPEDEKNPYRTGGWVVVKEETIRRMVHPAEMADDICKMRMAFVPDDAWCRLGLPLSPLQVEEKFKLTCNSSDAPAAKRIRGKYRLTCRAG
jgi:hypothetical protein